MAPKSAVSTHVLPGDPPVQVALRRSARTKSYYLRVSRTDGRVTLSLPTWASEAEAFGFLRSREPWLRKQLSKTARAEIARIGKRLPVQGARRAIVEGSGRSARFVNDEIQVPNDLRQGARIRSLLREMARERLASAADRYAAQLGRRYGKITLRDTRSRWGSCTSRGDLMFSWRLIMAPPEVLDYVAAHEVAHLAHMDHSAAFWAVCEDLCPSFNTHRAWLRVHGPELLAWRFDTEGPMP